MRTTDGGATWTPLNPDQFGNLQVFSIAISPADPQVIYIATYDIYQPRDYEWRSTDGGDTWTQILDGRFYQQVVADPVRPGTVYGTVLGSRTGFVGPAVQPGLPCPTPTLPDLCPLWDEVAGTVAPTSGIFVSRDYGETWSYLGLDGTYPYQLAIDPQQPSHMFVNAAGYVYISRDGGGSWSQSIETVCHLCGNGQSPWTLHNIAVATSKPASTVYVERLSTGEIWASDDDGETWSPSFKMENYGWAASLGGSSGSAGVIVGTCCFAGGAYVSADGGTEWNGGWTSPGLPGQSRGLPSDARITAVMDVGEVGIVAGADGETSTPGLWRAQTASDWDWQNPDLDWRNATTGMDAGSWVRALARNPADGTLYAATELQGVPPGAGALYKSTDGGSTWTKTNLSDIQVYAVAVATSSPSTVYAGTGSAVFKSSDAGATWQQKLSLSSQQGWVTALAIDPANPLIAFAGTQFDGVYKSVDGGDTWTQLTTGLPARTIASVAIDPNDSAIVYVGAQEARNGSTPGGIFRSADGGQTWADANPSMADRMVSSVLVDQRDSRRIYVGIGGSILWGKDDSQGAVLVSSDGGITWGLLGEPPVTAPVTSLAMDNTGHLFAGSRGGGVFRYLEAS